jgi:hypothetical protein
MPGTSLADRADLTGVAGLHLAGIKARGHFPTEQAALKCLYLGHRPPILTSDKRALSVIHQPLSGRMAPVR